MGESFNPSDFPALVKAPVVFPSSTPRNWNKVFAPEPSASKVLCLSHFPQEPEIVPFSEEKLTKGGEDWNLCLVGYSIGRRPFYEALLGAIKKTWSLKGSVQLLSLSDGFFLLRFSCSEDYEMVWSRGVWFLLGRPFVLQKWHPKFKPQRENFTSVPIWVKIHDLPLACWNSEGISRIASKIGIPLAANNLTEQKTRLTFARVCVLVDNNAAYPEEIKVSLDGDLVSLKVQYEWRPFPCDHCKSLMHYSSACPSKPEVDAEKPDNFTKTHRGRNFSRKGRNRNSSNARDFSKPPSEIPKPKVQFSQNPPEQQFHVPNVTTTTTNIIGLPLHYQPHSPTPQSQATNSPMVQDTSIPHNSMTVEAPMVSAIPNLNSPNDEEVVSASSSSLHILGAVLNQDVSVMSPNKFDVLIDEDVRNILEEPESGKIGQEVNSKKQKQKEKFKETVASKKSAKGKQVKKPHSSN
ncbi:uncharacterized protein LOC110102962 [Dendrobium catenatum]|uniref:uncharacterized protein LOC110102962 n=1 Tax=Dendrobium catenatum TaxID=906689 RepID=UPI0009F19221|nr:uncharacterized protein LOC110102962 [Dendrobium catenatum]